LVARAGLGTINHSLLSLEAIERDGLRVAGLVLSQRESDDPDMTLSNRAQIQRRWSGPIFILSADPSVLDPMVPARQ
jgi:dethiobiotin synthetase